MLQVVSVLTLTASTILSNLGTTYVPVCVPFSTYSHACYVTFAVALALLFLANLALSLHLAAAKMPSLPAWLASYHLQAFFARCALALCEPL